MTTVLAELTPQHTLRNTYRDFIHLNTLQSNTTQYNEFLSFMKLYNKTYANSTVEQYRYNIFQHNLHIIAQANAQHIINIDHEFNYNITDLTIYGINQFSDLTQNEFNSLYRTYRVHNYDKQTIDSVVQLPIHTPIPDFNVNEATVNFTTGDTIAMSDTLNITANTNQYINNTMNTVRRKLKQYTTSNTNRPKLPPGVDWSLMGATTAVGSQGTCGACWSFSSVEQLESQYYIQTGILPVLSIQQVTSCDPNNDGCSGGDPTVAYQYINQYGVMLAQYDKYTNGDSTVTESCQYTSSLARYRLTGWRWASPPCTSQDPLCQNVNELLLAQQITAYGPASICITADNFQFYTGGIMNDITCSSGLYSMDHCLQLVGYGTGTTGQMYWILKNQWGTAWGEDGYMRLGMGRNLCGIANEASFVAVQDL